MTTLLGTTADGRTLTYDASLYEFFLDGEQASFADAQMLDARGFLRWRADVLRDWFVHIDSTALASCNARARALAAARGADRALGAGRTRAALPARQDCTVVRGLSILKWSSPLLPTRVIPRDPLSLPSWRPIA